MPSPWFKFSRRYVLSSFFGQKDYDKIYIWMASNAAQTDHNILNGNREIVLRPGQFLTGRHRACDELGLTEKKWLNRVKSFEKAQLIDAKGTNRYTIVTLIDPDTYEWQKGIYSRKRYSKIEQKGTAKVQQRSTTIEEKELYNSYCAGAREEREEGGELSEEDSKRFEASFSSTKTFVLEVWKRERGRYGLPYVKSPRNFRMADSVAAMIDGGEWTSEDWEKAVRTFMADPWAREHGGINAVYEEFERWVSAGGKSNGNNRAAAATSATRLGGKEHRAGKFDTIDADNFGTGTGG